jgi:hypothetical protein
VIVFREGEAASESETYLRLEDGSAFSQRPAFRPFWNRGQWACEAGTAAQQLKNTIECVHVHNRMY